MKNLLSVLFFLSFVLISCSSDNDDTNPYSEKQQQALTIMKGSFEDTSFETGNSGPTSITFGSQYAQNVDIYKDGLSGIDNLLIRAQGECVWHQRYLSSQYNEDVNCYYEVSSDASYFILVYKGGSKDKSLYQRFDLKILNQNGFTLKDKDLSLPYNFVKKN